MKNHYVKHENNIDTLLSFIEIMINHSQSILENKNIPLIDRAYFFHVFNISHSYWTELFNMKETVDVLKNANQDKRIKFLLTNLPDEDTNDHT